MKQGGTLRVWGMSVRYRTRTLVTVLALMTLACLLAGVQLTTGTFRLSVPEVLDAMFGHQIDLRTRRIVLGIRLPRVLTAILVGASLGMAGTVFQSITRNPLGSPDVIGFTTGAATGAIVQIILFNAGAYQTALAAAVAGMATALGVFLLAHQGQSAGGHRLVLIGIGVGATLSGVNTMLVVMGDLDQALAAQVWLAGSLNARSWSNVGPAALGFVVFAPVAMMQARRLTIMEMGDDMAYQLGVNVERTRLVVVVSAVGLTSVATAAAGPIAFVALAAPHLSKALTGSRTLPIFTSAVMGAALVSAADLISIAVSDQLLIPIGVATGFLGGLYLLAIVVLNRR